MYRIFWVLSLALAASHLIAYAIHRSVLGPAQNREEAFAAILSGKLSIGPDGVVLLPTPWADASPDARAYVTHSPEKTTWVLFVKETHQGDFATGYLFCDKPAKAAAKGVIEINYPNAHSQVAVKVVRIASAYSFEVVAESRK